MDIKEAITIIEDRECCNCQRNGCNNCKTSEALRVSIKALEKQIPKKAVEHYGWTGGYCPVCQKHIDEYIEDINSLSNEDLYTGKRGSYRVEYIPHKYCSNCGQAIDWSE